jgi:hypothetical protein
MHKVKTNNAGKACGIFEGNKKCIQTFLFGKQEMHTNIFVWET